MDQASILFNEPPLVISPTLAKILGLNEAIILQQMHYWLQKSPKIRDDRAWIYNSYGDWLEQLPFRSVDTIKRAINKLVADGLLIKGDFNRMSFDKTNWYTIDYETLKNTLSAAQSMSAKCTDGSMQNAQIEECNLHQPIPETNQRLTTENKESKKERPKFDAMIKDYTENADLIDALHEFIKMRITIKKPPTNRALTLIFSKLDKFEDDVEKIAILNQSIVNSWQDIYPLKTQQRTQSKSPLEQLMDWESENA